MVSEEISVRVEKELHLWSAPTIIAIVQRMELNIALLRLSAAVAAWVLSGPTAVHFSLKTSKAIFGNVL